MEVKLSDEDFERLAGLLERKIGDRVIGLLAAGPVYDALSDRARMFATSYLSKDTFEIAAVQAMREALQADGEKLLRRIVTEAVAQVRKDDPELHKEIAKGVYEAVRNHAERLRTDAGGEM